MTTSRRRRACRRRASTPGSHQERTALFNHAYQGRTSLTMAMAATNMPYEHRFGAFASEVYRAPLS